MSTTAAWKKGLAGLFALLLLVGPAAAGEDISAEVEIDEWFNPVALSEVVATVRELEWSWTEFEGDVELETMRVSYRLVGDTVVGGADATEVELIVDGSLWKIWLAADGSVLQAEIEGELMPQMFADMVVGPMLTGLFWPFTMADAYGVEQALTDIGPGWELRSSDTGTRQIGDMEVSVQELAVSLRGEPYLEPGEQVDYLWVIGDFGPFHMLVEWRVTDIDADDVIAVRMVVESVVPR